MRRLCRGDARDRANTAVQVDLDDGPVVYLGEGAQLGYLPQDLELDSEKSVLDECRTIFQVVLDHGCPDEAGVN